jgi:hypothetical protein
MDERMSHRVATIFRRIHRRDFVVKRRFKAVSTTLGDRGVETRYLRRPARL